ncbi:MAG: GumC family protein [Candidatus Zhuqueibacterota bacterium]
MTQYELNIRDFWRVIRKRKYFIAGVVATIAVVSAVYSVLNRPQPIFESVASVKIERTNTLTGVYLQAVTYNPEDNIATQAEVIRSFPVLQKVSQELGYVDSSATFDHVLSDDAAVSAILDLMSKVSTSQEGLTNIINIIVQSADAEETQKIANTIARVYIAENSREKNQRIVNALDFIRKQLQVIGERLNTAEEDVRQYREQEKLITLETKTSMVSRELEMTEDEYFQVKRRRQEIESILSNLSAEKGEFIRNRFIGLDGQNQSPTFSLLANRLADLFLQRDELLIHFKENHPDIQQLDKKIEEIFKNIRRELTAQYESLVRSEKILEAEVEKSRAAYKTLPRDGLELARLQRRVMLNEEIYTLLESKHQEALLQNSEKIQEAALVKPALRGYRVNPPASVWTTCFIGGLVGLILGLLGAFILESIDTSFETIEEVERSLNMAVVGIIPYYDSQILKERLRSEIKLNLSEQSLNIGARLISFFAPKSTLAESYRALRTNIHYLFKKNGMHSLLVTSATVGEGKTTTCANLAITMSQIGLKTLLVDCDLRRPFIHKMFGIEREPGLSNILINTAQWEDCIQTITDIMMGELNLDEVLLAPGMENLNILTAGTAPSTPSELINSAYMPELLTILKSHYDVVIIDSSPVLPAADATILASRVDGVLLVYQVGRTARGALRRTKIQLENVNANMMGIVINNFKVELNPDYKDFNYHKYYSYGAETPDATSGDERSNWQFTSIKDAVQKTRDEIKTRIKVVK